MIGLEAKKEYYTWSITSETVNKSKFDAKTEKRHSRKTFNVSRPLTVNRRWPILNLLESEN